jgi:hypothetical protein
MIERHPVAGPRAPVVAGHHEALEAELLHHLDLILGHAPEGVVAVVGPTPRLAAVAVAAQVGGDHRESRGEPRRDQTPVDVRQRIAVQQEQRRPGAPHHAVDRHLRIAGTKIEAAEPLVQRIH